MTTKQGLVFSLTLGALCVAHLQLGICESRAAEKPTKGTLPDIIVDTNALPKDTRGVTSFAPVVKRVAPSVVTIYSSKMVRRSAGGSPFDDPTFRRFFNLPDEEDEEAPPRGRNGRRGAQPRQQKEQSLGSGVVVSSDGYILSNNHVVEGAENTQN